MSTEPSSVYLRTQEIRKFINDGRKHHELRQDKGKFSQVCSSLDAVEDSEQAIALEQLVVLKPTPTLDEEEGGESADDLAIRLVNEPLDGMGSVGESAADSVCRVDVGNPFFQLCQHGAEEEGHMYRAPHPYAGSIQ